MAHRFNERLAKTIVKARILLSGAIAIALLSCRSSAPTGDAPILAGTPPVTAKHRAAIQTLTSKPTHPTSAPTLTPIPPQLILRLKATDLTVALTFDACQTKKPARYDPEIIGILRRTRTPATLLLGGRWMEAHPKETKDLAADPLFELGNHSYIHPHMTKIPLHQVKIEILKTQDIMYSLTGRQAVLFRPPFGEYDNRLIATAGELGLRTLMWNVETGDPDPHESARAIIHTVLTRTKPGSIVIMHVNGRGWHSAEALPTIIRTLRARGYRFVRVSDALN